MCGETLPRRAALYVCSECLGPLEVTYDYDSIREAVSPAEVSTRAKSLWRYRELLPIEGEPRTGFHSGFTPARPRGTPRQAAGRLRAVHQGRLRQPSDLLVQGPRRLGRGDARRGAGFTVFACASTGNLANSVSAHAARLGLD